MNRRFLWVLSVLMALFIWACSSDATDDANGGDDDLGLTDDDGASVTFERGVMLTNWADNIIISVLQWVFNNFCLF